MLKAGSVAVYPLADPATIFGAASAIAPVFQQAVGDSGGDGELDVDPSTAMLQFRRPSLLDATEGELDNPEKAEQAARRFIEAVRARSASLRSGDGLALPGLLPPNLRTAGLSIGVNQTGDPAHWVVRFTSWISPGLRPPSAPAGESHPASPSASERLSIGRPASPVGPLAPSLASPVAPPSPKLPVTQAVEVLNSAIDVRVTARGGICAFQSRWRPLARNEVITTGLLEAPPDEHGSETEPVIGYLVASDGAPQRFLAPYFLLSGHAGVIASPASGYSLTALIVQAGDSEFRVIVSGNSPGGQLRYGWAGYSLSEPEKGMFGLGREDRVQIEPGIYNLIVDVMDLTTGAICRTESIASVRSLL